MRWEHGAHAYNSNQKVRLAEDLLSDLWVEPRHQVRDREVGLLSRIKVAIVLVAKFFVTLPEVDKKFVNLRRYGQ